MKRILLVDDEKLIAELLCVILVSRGYDCRTASDGVEAMSLLNSGERFDLIVCNYLMPHMNGLQVLDHVKKQFPGIPFILYSGFPSAKFSDL